MRERLTLFRAVFYSNPPLLSTGKIGRFHRGLKYPTVYAAERWKTAWSEVTLHWKANAAPGRYRKVHISARLSSIVDLTDESVREQYGITEADLVSHDYTACQNLAARLRGSGVEAIRTFSRADPDGRVLVVFLECLKSTSYINADLVESIEE